MAFFDCQSGGTLILVASDVKPSTVNYGQSTTLQVDCTSVDGYKNKSADDFYLIVKGTKVTISPNAAQILNRETYLGGKAYDANTGTLTVTAQAATGGNLYVGIMFDVYVR